MSNNCSHNWFHLGDRKAKWRRFYFDFSLVGHREWRVSIWVSSFPHLLETWIITTFISQISHALSHHLLTNTYADLEVSSVEPLLQYLPVPMVFILQFKTFHLCNLSLCRVACGLCVSTWCLMYLLSDPTPQLSSSATISSSSTMMSFFRNTFCLG